MSLVTCPKTAQNSEKQRKTVCPLHFTDLKWPLFCSQMSKMGSPVPYDLGDRLGTHRTAYHTYMSLVTYAQKPLKMAVNPRFARPLHFTDLKWPLFCSQRSKMGSPVPSLSSGTHNLLIFDIHQVWSKHIPWDARPRGPKWPERRKTCFFSCFATI